MNISTLKIALSAAQSAYDQFKKYRDEKAVETYERLSTAAESLGGIEGIRERSDELIEESRREAGQVTKAARARLEKALSDARERGQEVSSGARKVSRKAQKKADRQAGRLKAKAQGKAAPKNRKFTLIALLTLLFTAVGGAAFWFLRKNRETPGTEVPEIREYILKEEAEQQPESTLVYSTETPADEEPATGKLMSEEELLASLDDQLAKHRLEEDEEPAEDEATEDTAQAAEEVAEEPAEEVETPTETAEEIQAEFDRKNARQREQGEKK